jgi:hypothetical protein
LADLAFHGCRQCDEVDRPALDGLRQEKFKLNLLTGWDLCPQTGKENLAVNALTLTHLRRQVKSDFGKRQRDFNRD